ncbi:probable tubulin polyglutamylase TTLL2 [Antedon mediterranea]|uniref:probable tubulin polyglutamylase TTLL2 n=1 Tax=Antedon mediterranea TaxID=105859 RepID=UPI003AF5A557
MTQKSQSPTNPNPFIFRLNDNGSGPEVIQNVFLEKGWEEFDEERHRDHEWNLWWRTSRFRLSDYHDIHPWQQLNHFPRTTGITKKDMLARNMKRMRGVYGASIFNFTPLAFILPNDYTKFVAEYSKLLQSDSGNKEFWICKPADLSRGRGIFLFKDLSELAYDCSAVVQKYLSNPLLISGYKFDLRVYVVVLSFHPLVIYIYDEGIVRFSTEKFDLSSIHNQFSHLTNTSINKLGPSYTADKERIGPGCKWSFATLRNYFHQQNIEGSVIWKRISNIVIYTILAQTTSVPKVSNCFELFGFDILIDNTLKPWLLEVNFSPALGLDCSTDHTVKSALLNDIIEMLSFTDDHREQKQLLNSKPTYGGVATNRNVRRSESPQKRLSLPKTISKSKSKLSLSRSSTTSPLKLVGKSKEIIVDENKDVKAPPQPHSNSTKPKTVAVLYKKQSIHPCIEPTVKSSSKVTSENPSLNLTSGTSQLKSVTSDAKISNRKAGHLTAGNGENKKLNSTLKSTRQTTKSLRCVEKTRTGRNETNKNGTRVSFSKSTGSLINSKSSMKPEITSRPTSRESSLQSLRKPASILNTKKGLLDLKFDRTNGSKHILKPAAKIGDFKLIFPFNEDTKRASWPNLDIRTVIREAQKQLRRTMCRGHIVRGSAGTFTKPHGEQIIQQIPNLNMTRGQTINS